MKNWFCRMFVIAVVVPYVFAQTTGDFHSDVKGPPYPWTNLNFFDDTSTLRFAIFSDRTGGHREGVFAKAVRAANLLVPDLVMSVGDLIEGHEENPAILTEQANELDGILSRLRVPFFYTAGNHDISNFIAAKWYSHRRGRPYYHFVYKNVLFLVLCTEDPPPSHISEEQLAYMKQALESNFKVRWTFVFMHKPIFHPAEENHAAWGNIESLLKDRPYTAFAGHWHAYEPYTSGKHKYTILATTGGASDLTGSGKGRFDEIVWVTLRKNDKEPIIVNLELNGVLPWDFRPPVPLDYVSHVKGGVTFSSKPMFLSGCPKETLSATIRLMNTADIPTKVQIHFAPLSGIRIKPTEQSLNLLTGSSKELLIYVNFIDGKIFPQTDVQIPCTYTAEYQLEGFKPFSLTRQIFVGLTRKHTCPRVMGKINVDGKLDDWPALAYDVSQPAQVLINPTTYHGPKDGRFSFGVAYDNDFLYIAVEVFDDVISPTATTVWQQDGLEVRINANPLDKQSSANEWTDVLPILVAPAGKGRDMLIWKPQKLPDGTKVQSVRTSTGYITEIAVPTSYLESRQGKDWKSFRLNVAMDDFDGIDGAQLWWQSDWRTPQNLPGSGTFERK